MRRKRSWCASPWASGDSLNSSATFDTLKHVFFHDDLDYSSMSRLLGVSFKTINEWQRRIRHKLPHSFNAHSLGSCSVVGRSGSLLHHPHGRTIDTSEAVFRSNLSPTRGFEAYVGKRTTHRIWGSVTQHGLPEETPWRNDSILVYCGPPSRRVDKCWRSISNSSRPLPRLHPLFARELRVHIRDEIGLPRSHTTLTTGTIALGVALHLCKNVTIFGYGNGSHSWNCVPSGRDTCGRYDIVPPRSRLQGTCKYHWKMKSYMDVSVPNHDLFLEWAWIQSLLSRKLVHAPPCCKAH
mmetsp:Transcript_33866/g.55943  ORF Transcript_33866/g.55943 Transcript_33866/m.55943 type:complete len:295 (+) Transcript_33866:141-1025(+)